jgi:hypothetical protein
MGRRLVTACGLGAASLATLAVAPVANAAPGEIGGREQSLSFVEALSAIPGATDALAAARQAVAPSRERARVAQASARAATSSLQAASERVRDVVHARTRAELTVARTQATLEDAARAMYAAGGTAPSLAEVLLTSSTTVGFTTSLLTREHLLRASSVVVMDQRKARRAGRDAAVALTGVRTDHIASAEQASITSREAAMAAKALADAQRAVVRARSTLKNLMRITKADRSAEYGKVRKCGDWVTKLLSRSGFEGENLREAWAIIMRESGGREDAISVSNDLGLFQINTSTWKGQPWFDRKALLTRKYNAKIGHLISRGGRSWYSWGLDGHGRPDPRAYVNAGWTPEHIRRSIVLPYIAWYQQYPCRPAYETDYPFDLPTPRSDEDSGEKSQFDGGGFAPPQLSSGRRER